MRIAAALLATKRRDKFVILHNKVMLFHTSPRPSRTARSPPAILGAGSALVRSPDQMIMIGMEDGEERATSTASAKFR